MKKLIVLLIAVTAGIGTLSGQKSAALQALYQTEWSTFREAVRMRNDRAVTDTTFDVRFYHLTLEVSLNAFSKYIHGNLLCKVTSRVSGLSKITLSLQHALYVDSITGHCSTFSVTGDSINIVLNKTFGKGESAQVRIWYRGVPRMAGGYKGLRYDFHHGMEPVIATLSTPYLAHYWYPCKDGPEDKADSVYLDITVPDTVINGQKVIAVSNGMLENVSTASGKTTYSWRHRYPIVTYYVMIAISNYAHFQQSFAGQGGESFPIDYYVFAENDSISRLGVAEMPAVMQFYSELFGQYPFRKEKYAMSELGYYGAIENQTNTITNNMSPGWFDVSMHELSHMWFGDMITCADWHHGWLNEGFATYAEALWTEHKGGMAAYHAYMNSTQATMGGTLYLQNDLDTFNIFQPIIYSKGAWVLHMLRGVLSDPVFFDCLKTYASTPEFMYKNATTEDFRKVAETVSGKDLAAFFDQWVYDAYYPKYQYNYRQDSLTNVLTLHIYQVQASLGGWREVFEMPIRVRITDTTGHVTLITVMNNQVHQEYNFRLTGGVLRNGTSVQLDPDKWIIRTTAFKPNLPIGIPETPGSGSVLSAWPNPASRELFIRCPREFLPAPFELLDLCGRTMSRGILEAPVTAIPVADLPGGFYLLKIDDGTKPHWLKFLKQ